MASAAGVGSGVDVGIGAFLEAMDRRRLIRGSREGRSMAIRLYDRSVKKKRKDK